MSRKAQNLAKKRIIQILKEDCRSNKGSFYIELPEADELTDIDSGGENNDSDDEYIEISASDNYNIKESSSDEKLKEDLDFTDNDFPSFDTSETEKTPEELFELFFDDDVMSLIISESTKYAEFCKKPDPRISKEELKVFVAILIVSGYNKLPGKSYFWDCGDDMRNRMIYNAMRRDRFQLIMSSFHFADNTQIDTTDKMYKLRPLINILERNFHKNFIPKQHLDYDESMIKYYGRHSCKQYIRGKPIRFGYKVWSLNSTNGYLVSFEVYQGKGPKSNSQYGNKFGKCTAPLAVMIDELPEEYKTLPFRFYLDNLFTSMEILSHLKSMNYSATGTMRENRIPMNCPLRAKTEPKTKMKKGVESAVTRKIVTKGVRNVSGKGRGVKITKRKVVKKVSRNGVQKLVSNELKQETKKVMKKGMKNLKRGSFESVKCKKENIIITKWVDNNVVTMASTIHGVNPISTVSRYSKDLQKKVQIPQPQMFAEYNKYMGGTDRMNQNIGAYRIGIRGKKWYWPIFTWLIDASVQNSWIMLKEQKQITQLEFRRQLATAYLTKYKIPPLSTGRKPKSVNQLQCIERFDGIKHWIRKTCDSRRRCAYNKCKSRVRTQCSKCDVGLCVDCFEKYHVNSK